jgi:hypothetical protein
MRDIAKYIERIDIKAKMSNVYGIESTEISKEITITARSNDALNTDNSQGPV